MISLVAFINGSLKLGKLLFGTTVPNGDAPVAPLVVTLVNTNSIAPEDGNVGDVNSILGPVPEHTDLEDGVADIRGFGSTETVTGIVEELQPSPFLAPAATAVTL